MMKNILVIGGGSWGTCLSKLLVENKNNVFLWEYNEKTRNVIREKRENPVFLPNIKLPKELNVVDSYCETLKNEKIDVILLATPIEIKSKKRISEVIDEELSGKDYSYVLLAGPTHAEEVALKLPSAILSVSLDEKAALEIQHLFSNSYFRVYTGTDLVGAELSGAVKNCLAIAAGISDGLGFGDNSKAALITRGINEILEIGKYYHADPKTFMGLSGLGDIIVTCTSKHSRNRYVGEELGKGRKIDDIISSMKMVSEGAETIKALYAIIKENNIQAPIMSALYEVIYENRPVNELVSLFMNRNLRSEFI